MRILQQLRKAFIIALELLFVDIKNTIFKQDEVGGGFRRIVILEHVRIHTMAGNTSQKLILLLWHKVGPRRPVQQSVNACIIGRHAIILDWILLCVEEECPILNG